MVTRRDTYTRGSPSTAMMFAETGLWIGSGYAAGLEKRALVGGGTRAFRSALGIANMPATNTLTKAGWGAAGKATVRKQFAKIAVSRIGSAVFTGLNVAMYAPLVYQGVKGAVTGLRKIGREGPRLEFGERFFDTKGTYTERQRAVRAITSSRMSVRSALGNEAALLHR